jgi:hypothetical protein
MSTAVATYVHARDPISQPMLWPNCGCVRRSAW